MNCDFSKLVFRKLSPFPNRCDELLYSSIHWERFFAWENGIRALLSHLHLHSKPLPSYPRLQRQENDPGVLRQSACRWQLLFADRHSSTSTRRTNKRLKITWKDEMPWKEKDRRWLNSKKKRYQHYSREGKVLATRRAPAHSPPLPELWLRAYNASYAAHTRSQTPTRRTRKRVYTILLLQPLLYERWAWESHRIWKHGQERGRGVDINSITLLFFFPRLF